ncbi:MAG: hypothetical protein HKM95_17010, partial [Inquilinus sp.]|nr:hypothetical protein [Inquilinus sp.]
MHIQRDVTQVTAPDRDSGSSLVRQAVRRLRVPRPTQSRFAATVKAAQVKPAPRTQSATFGVGAREGAEHHAVLTRQLADALESAMAVGWPDAAEPRNEEWRRLIWLARRG